jgi:hypothetical protein
MVQPELEGKLDMAVPKVLMLHGQVLARRLPAPYEND